MRFEGTLEKWDDARGFGFIAPVRGNGHVFVHISAFAHDGRRPRVGETLTFEVELGVDGRKQAVDVRRAAAATTRAASSRDAEQSAHRARRPARPARAPAVRRTGRMGLMISVVAVACVGAFGWTRYASPVRQETRAAPLPVAAPVDAARYRCDGRKHCSQMTSCDEAKFFLRNCPDTRMDGDGDGIPCERQWCTR